MEPSAGNEQRSDTGRLIRRFGPIAVIAVIAVVAVVLVATGGDDDDETAVSPTTTSGDGAGTTAEPEGEDGLTESPYPEGVMDYDTAQELGLDIDFGERCDPETGRVKSATFFAPVCWAPFEGDNGGATAPGVTGDSIEIVWYLTQDQDPIMRYITSAILNDDTNADEEHTMRALLEYYETYYETYGRSVDLTVVEASGTVNDEVSARADAVRIAEEIEPFMVWGGPLLTNAFQEELLSRGIGCLGCGPSQPASFYAEHAPLSWVIPKSSQQLNLLVAEYIGKRLLGDPAVHAGDESMHDTERVFGRIWIESSPASVDLNEQFEAALAEYGGEIAESVPFALDPATIQETAASTIARLKEAGVTSVIISGDPVSPGDFTRAATAQDYFPEWIVTGSALIDTNAFSRSYDQEQWSNAFGVSNLSVPVARDVAGDFFTYTWFHGEDPRADDTIGVIDPYPAVFYAALSGVGPDLTMENWGNALMAGEPTRYAVTAPQLSWGDEDRWPDELEPDYFGVDDISEIWWDPDVEGPDEIDNVASGMWRFVDGGRRYLWGEIPEGPPAAFEEEGTVTMYEERPPDERSPEYDPLPPA